MTRDVVGSTTISNPLSGHQQQSDWKGAMNAVRAFGVNGTTELGARIQEKLPCMDLVSDTHCGSV